MPRSSVYSEFVEMVSDPSTSVMEYSKLAEDRLGWSKMNRREARVLQWLLEDRSVSIQYIVRPSRGVDFIVYGDVGVEVKSRDNYFISRNQLMDMEGSSVDGHSISSVVMVVVRDGYNVEIMDVVHDVKMEKDVGDVGLPDLSSGKRWF